MPATTTFEDVAIDGAKAKATSGFLEVPIVHDPDASLESVDLNDGEAEEGQMAPPNQDLLDDASPLPRDAKFPERYSCSIYSE